MFPVGIHLFDGGTPQVVDTDKSALRGGQFDGLALEVLLVVPGIAVNGMAFGHASVARQH